MRSDGRIPTAHNYHWHSSSNQLEVSEETNPTHYRKKATYVVRVRSERPLSQVVLFSMLFYYDSTMR